MLLHLPIFENRIAQFGAKFAALPDGNWAFHRTDWEEGWLIPAGELPGLLEQHAGMVRLAQRVTNWWMAIAFGLILVLVIATHGRADSLWGAAIMGLPLPWVLWQLYRADRLPLRQNRMAVSPPRGLRTGAWARMAAFPLSLPVMMIGIGTLLLVQLWRYGELVSDPVGLATGLFVIAFGGVILWARRG